MSQKMISIQYNQYPSTSPTPNRFLSSYYNLPPFSDFTTAPRSATTKICLRVSEASPVKCQDSTVSPPPTRSSWSYHYPIQLSGSKKSPSQSYNQNLLTHVGSNSVQMSEEQYGTRLDGVVDSEPRPYEVIQFPHLQVALGLYNSPSQSSSSIVSTDVGSTSVLMSQSHWAGCNGLNPSHSLIDFDYMLGSGILYSISSVDKVDYHHSNPSLTGSNVIQSFGTFLFLSIIEQRHERFGSVWYIFLPFLFCVI